MSLAPPPAILPPTSAPRPAAPQVASPEPLFDVRIDQLYYGDALAVRDVRMSIPKGKVTALIGPSGCGKSTVLRCLNRMNDLIPGFRLEGEVKFLGQDIYSPEIDPVLVRRNVGMVFQQPNPFATSIYKNVAFGLKLNKYRGDRTVKVREALEGAALWEEVKDKLNASGLSLSGGQQQRLCIARAIATDPPVLLMDEPCSALDPIATAKIEELIDELVQHYTIVMVTHNLAQAMRVSDYTGFFYVDTARGGRTGHLIEFGETDQVLNRPKHTLTRQYVEGAFG